MYQEPMLLIGLHGVEEATRKQFGDEYVEAAKPPRVTPSFHLFAWFRRPKSALPCPEVRPNAAGVK
jgi:hypothetical protein